MFSTKRLCSVLFGLMIVSAGYLSGMNIARAVKESDRDFVAAIENNNVWRVARLLCEHPSYASVSIYDENLEVVSPMHLAAAINPDPRILRLLDRHSPIDQRSETGKTPLFFAIRDNPSAEVLDYIINRTLADTNVLDFHQNSLWHAVLSTKLPEDARKRLITFLMNVSPGRDNLNPHAPNQKGIIPSRESFEIFEADRIARDIIQAPYFSEYENSEWQKWVQSPEKNIVEHEKEREKEEKEKQEISNMINELNIHKDMMKQFIGTPRWSEFVKWVKEQYEEWKRRPLPNIPEPVTRSAAQKSNLQILGLTPTASIADIKAARNKLALQYHPDKGGNPEQFRIIQEAYEALRRALNFL